MFKKLSALLAFTALALSLVAPTPALAIENQFVYVEQYTQESASGTYKAGDNIKGSFVLRNAGTKDATNIFYRIELIQADVQKNDIKTYTVVSEQKSKSLSVAAKSTSAPFSFSFNVPSSVKGDNFEIKVSAVSSTDQPISWHDSASFSIQNDSAIISIPESSILLSTGEVFLLQTGPTIYKDKEPKSAQLKATLQNDNGTSLNVIPTMTINEWPKVDGRKTLYSQKLDSVTLGANASGEFSVDLPNFDYAPGVYEGKIQFEDGSGKDLAPALEFRYIVYGEKATIHSLTSSVSYAQKSDPFVVTASITGSPVDLYAITRDSGTSSADATQPATESESQKVTLNLTVLNEKNRVVAEQATEVDLYGNDTFDFNLVAIDSAKALKAKLEVKKADGTVLAQYEGGLSANYDTIAASRNRTCVLWTIAISALVLMLIGLWIAKRKSRPVIAQTFSVLLGLGIAGSLLALSIMAPQRTDANPTYNTDPAKPGFVYSTLTSYYKGQVIEGTSAGTGGNDGSNFFKRSGYDFSIIVNNPVDAEYEPGQPFNISATARYHLCGNAPQDFFIGAVVGSDSAPSNVALNINGWPTASNGYSKAAAAQTLRDELVTANRNTPAEIDARVAAFNQKNEDPLRVQDNTRLYAEPISFGEPVWQDLTGKVKGDRSFQLNKNVNAPATVGIHKFWIGTLTKIHKEHLVVGGGRTGSGILSRNFENGRLYYQNNDPSILQFPNIHIGFLTNHAALVKGYQTYKVIPPAPTNLKADNTNKCNSVKLSWDAPSDVSQVSGYKLYRSTSANGPMTLVGTVDKNTLEFMDTIPTGMTGTVYYQVKSYHAGTGFESRPASTSYDLAGLPPANSCSDDDEDIPEDDGEDPGGNDGVGDGCTPGDANCTSACGVSTVGLGQGLTLSSNLCTGSATVIPSSFIEGIRNGWQWNCRANWQNSVQTCSATCAANTTYCPDTKTCETSCTDFCDNIDGNQTVASVYTRTSDGQCTLKRAEIKYFKMNPDTAEAACPAFWETEAPLGMDLSCKIGTQDVPDNNPDGTPGGPTAAVGRQHTLTCTEIVAGEVVGTQTKQARCYRIGEIIER